ncbi:flagellar hook-associated protein FlgL [Paralcaligenes sp. KSB-10]|jgi:flagellar hook-associated protein 3 FlgL|uniref:flagellar hook-associated protein FlgL n=1 Tax=Paralcaligenes sp. KSB-10 TaxID=2901142 RepID=UPI001E4084BA|nr:flagellar hook-associated protein FlgL [Paralcaligenes sp. KSB-10]UHL65307.1 flagellar hook-associated protein FlgL [Paralcaligenes sp. KSB-10]
MRISSSQFFQTGLNSINAQQADLMHIYQQIASGQRMVTPADDPLGAAQAINIAQSQTLNQRFADNRGVATQNLGTEDNVLGSATTLMQNIKTQLIQAGNGTLSDADRATLANVLTEAKASLLGLANSTDGNGQYMFSGFKGDTMPYVTDPVTGKVTYTGDTNQRLIQIDPTRQMAGSDVGSDIFARAVPGMRVYVTTGDPANTGTAQINTPTITNPAGSNVGNSFKITFSAGSPLQYQVDTTDATTGVTSSATFPYQAGGTVLDLTGGVQVQFSGDPKPGDTFTVSPGNAGNLDVFGTLDDMITALNKPVNGNDTASANLGNSLSTAIQKFNASYDNLLTVRASVGSRMNEIDALNANGTARGLGYASQLSTLENVDYYSATTQLQLRQSALQAASLAFKQIQGTSLFNTGSSG